MAYHPVTRNLVVIAPDNYGVLRRAEFDAAGTFTSWKYLEPSATQKTNTQVGISLNSDTNEIFVAMRAQSGEIHVGRIDANGNFLGWADMGITSPRAPTLQYHPAEHAMYLIAGSNSDADPNTDANAGGLVLAKLNQWGQRGAWQTVPTPPGSTTGSPVGMAWNARKSKLYLFAMSQGGQWVGSTFTASGAFEGWKASDMPSTVGPVSDADPLTGGVRIVRRGGLGNLQTLVYPSSIQ